MIDQRIIVDKKENNIVGESYKIEKNKLYMIISYIKEDGKIITKKFLIGKEST